MILLDRLGQLLQLQDCVQVATPVFFDADAPTDLLIQRIESFDDLYTGQPYTGAGPLEIQLTYMDPRFQWPYSVYRPQKRLGEGVIHDFGIAEKITCEHCPLVFECLTRGETKPTEHAA